MKNMFKRSLAAVMAVASLAVGMVGMSASASASVVYPSSRNWNIHWSPYDSNSPQTERLVAHGNGYYATMTEKAGSCSLNYVDISASDVTVSISEKNERVYMRPKLSNDYYVDFTVIIKCSGGNAASSSGTITIA